MLDIIYTYFLVYVMYNVGIGLIITTRHGEINDWYRRKVVEPTAFWKINKALGGCESCFAFWFSIIISLLLYIVAIFYFSVPIYCIALIPLFSLSQFKK